MDWICIFQGQLQTKRRIARRLVRLWAGHQGNLGQPRSRCSKESGRRPRVPEANKCEELPQFAAHASHVKTPLPATNNARDVQRHAAHRVGAKTCFQLITRDTEHALPGTLSSTGL
jgi:hypothetical protein